MIYLVTLGIIIITFIFLNIKIRITTYVMPWSSPLMEMNAIGLLKKIRTKPTFMNMMMR